MSGLRPCTAPAPTTVEVAAQLAELSEPARAMLEHVLAAGGEATTEDARHTLLPEDAATPAEELLSRRLLVPRGTGVGRGARRGRARAARRTHDGRAGRRRARRWRRRTRSERQVDRAAAGAAFEAVRRVELLLDLWGAEPPSALRSGGLGVRDLKATAAALHVDEATHGAARRDRQRRRPARHRGRRRRQPGVAADRPGRRLGAAAARGALGRAGPHLAGQPADAGPGRLARHRRQGVERAGARARRRCTWPRPAR